MGRTHEIRRKLGGCSRTTWPKIGVPISHRLKQRLAEVEGFTFAANQKCKLLRFRLRTAACDGRIKMQRAPLY